MLAEPTILPLASAQSWPSGNTWIWFWRKHDGHTIPYAVYLETILFVSLLFQKCLL